MGHKMAVTLALARLPLPTALGLQLCQHQWHEPPNDACSTFFTRFVIDRHLL